MKTHIDFSIFTLQQGAFGNITGEIELPILPQIGDSLSFAFKEGHPIDPSIGDISGSYK